MCCRLVKTYTPPSAAEPSGPGASGRFGNQFSQRGGEFRRWDDVPRPFRLNHPTLCFSSAYRIQTGLEKTEDPSINWFFSAARAITFQGRTGRLPAADEWTCNSPEVVSATFGDVKLPAYAPLLYCTLRLLLLEL